MSRVTDGYRGSGATRIARPAASRSSMSRSISAACTDRPRAVRERRRGLASDDPSLRRLSHSTRRPQIVRVSTMAGRRPTPNLDADGFADTLDDCLHVEKIDRTTTAAPMLGGGHPRPGTGDGASFSGGSCEPGADLEQSDVALFPAAVVCHGIDEAEAPTAEAPRSSRTADWQWAPGRLRRQMAWPPARS